MLYRRYSPNGVNGELYTHGARECFTIELPWLHNKPNCSCIPEGTYVLQKRFSKKHGWHIEVTGVKNRSLILLHPANDALKELKGCIAPVTELTGAGKGILSRMAFERLTEKVFSAMRQRTVLLTITRWKHDH
jgi:hypothetical protein